MTIKTICPIDGTVALGICVLAGILTLAFLKNVTSNKNRSFVKVEISSSTFSYTLGTT
jgi:hypothetical protein